MLLSRLVSFTVILIVVYCTIANVHVNASQQQQQQQPNRVMRFKIDPHSSDSTVVQFTKQYEKFRNNNNNHDEQPQHPQSQGLFTQSYQYSKPFTATTTTAATTTTTDDAKWDQYLTELTQQKQQQQQQQQQRPAHQLRPASQQQSETQPRLQNKEQQVQQLQTELTKILNKGHSERGKIRLYTFNATAEAIKLIETFDYNNDLEKLERYVYDTTSRLGYLPLISLIDERNTKATDLYIHIFNMFHIQGTQYNNNISLVSASIVAARVADIMLLTISNDEFLSLYIPNINGESHAHAHAHAPRTTKTTSDGKYYITVKWIYECLDILYTQQKDKPEVQQLFQNNFNLYARAKIYNEFINVIFNNYNVGDYKALAAYITNMMLNHLTQDQIRQCYNDRELLLSFKQQFMKQLPKNIIDTLLFGM